MTHGETGHNPRSPQRPKAATIELELPPEALRRSDAVASDLEDSHASLDLVVHTQRTGVRGDSLAGRGRIVGFEESFEDSAMLAESFAGDDRDEPRRPNPNTYSQLEAIQDMTEEDEEDLSERFMEDAAKPAKDEKATNESMTMAVSTDSL